jgi:hypothetical protein
MAKFYREITDELLEFIRQQKMFFNATAPTDNARINVSPKGYNSLVVLDSKTVCYVDLPGSGNETANHVRDNGRLTLMWCSFDTRPWILRVYCKCEIIGREDPRFSEWLAQYFPDFNPSIVRQLIQGTVEAAQTSCGYGVPLYEYAGDRPLLQEAMEVKRAQGKLEGYLELNCVRNDEKFPIE